MASVPDSLTDTQVVAAARLALKLKLPVEIHTQDRLENTIASGVQADYTWREDRHVINVLASLEGKRRISFLCHELVHAHQVEKLGWTEFLRTYPKNPKAYWGCWQEKQARTLGAKLCSIIVRMSPKEENYDY